MMKRSKDNGDFLENSLTTAPTLPPPPEVEAEGGEEEEEEFVVEKVKRRKIVEDGTEMFLIKWEGYSDSENTWEPREYLNCPKLIAKFEKKAKKKQEFLLEKKKRRQHQSSFEEEQKHVFGFARLLEPESIIAAVRRPTSKLSNLPSDSLSEKSPSSVETRLAAESLISNGDLPLKKLDGQEKILPDLADPASTKIIQSAAVGGSTGNAIQGKEGGSPPAFDESFQHSTYTAPEAKFPVSSQSESTHWFLIKWKCSSEADLVDSKEANAKCPQLVIQFYERRLKFESPDELRESEGDERKTDKADSGRCYPEKAEPSKRGAISSDPKPNRSLDSEATEDAEETLDADEGEEHLGLG